jgi:hypothetical protein
MNEIQRVYTLVSIFDNENNAFLSSGIELNIELIDTDKRANRI